MVLIKKNWNIFNLVDTIITTNYKNIDTEIKTYYYNKRRSFMTIKRYDEDFKKSIVSLHENGRSFNNSSTLLLIR